MLNLWRKFANNQDGATAVEYGLIAVLIVVAIIAALTNVSSGLNNNFNKVVNALR